MSEQGQDDVVEVYRAEDGWRWRRVAPNNEVVADSGEAYVNKSDCLDGARRQGVVVQSPEEEA